MLSYPIHYGAFWWINVKIKRSMIFLKTFLVIRVNSKHLFLLNHFSNYAMASKASFFQPFLSTKRVFHIFEQDLRDMYNCVVVGRTLVKQACCRRRPFLMQLLKTIYKNYNKLLKKLLKLLKTTENYKKSECEEYLFLTKYKYWILFGFQKSPNTK